MELRTASSCAQACEHVHMGSVNPSTFDRPALRAFVEGHLGQIDVNQSSQSASGLLPDFRRGCLVARNCGVLSRSLAPIDRSFRDASCELAIATGPDYRGG